MLKLLRRLSSLGGRNSSSMDDAIASNEDLLDDAVVNPNVAAVAYNELLIAIDAMRVTWRPSRQGDEAAGPILYVATLGSWTWTDRTEARQRVSSKYPELSERECSRAVRLIEAKIGVRNVSAYRRGPAVDRIDREEHQFWEGHHRV